ncbi:hypothetical protein AUP68_14223 [Ilyonectria robusta]
MDLRYGIQGRLVVDSVSWDTDQALVGSVVDIPRGSIRADGNCYCGRQSVSWAAFETMAHTINDSRLHCLRAMTEECESSLPSICASCLRRRPCNLWSCNTTTHLPDLEVRAGR